MLVATCCPWGMSCPATDLRTLTEHLTPQVKTCPCMCNTLFVKSTRLSDEIGCVGSLLETCTPVQPGLRCECIMTAAPCGASHNEDVCLGRCCLRCALVECVSILPRKQQCLQRSSRDSTRSPSTCMCLHTELIKASTEGSQSSLSNRRCSTNQKVLCLIVD